MNITRDNYEVFFIDHFDGKLDAVQTAELFLFLDTNPDLKQEFEMFGEMSLEDDGVSFDGKDSLKRGEITEANAPHYFVASLEGDLSAEEEDQLKKYVAASDERRKEQQLFMLTKIPAEQEEFPLKAQLRQPVPMASWFNGPVRYAAAAAVVIMILSGGYLMLTNTQQESIQVAESTVQESTAPVQENTNVNMPGSDNPGIDSVSQDSFTDQPQEDKNASAPSASKKSLQVKQRPPVPQMVAHSQPVISEPKEEQQQQQIQEQPQPQLQAQAQPQEQQPQFASAQPSGNANYMTVLQAVKQRAEKELSPESETDPERELATLEGKRKGGVKVLGLLSKGLQKVAGDKVTLSTAYDVDGQMMAYEFKAGGITIQK